MEPPTSSRPSLARGVARITALVVAPLAVCAGVVFIGRTPTSAPTVTAAVTRASALAPVVAAMPAPEGPAAASKATAALLIRLGLDAEALAAAGVTAQQVPTLVGAVHQAVEAGQDGLAALDAQHGQARALRDRLERDIAAGTAAEEEIAAFPGASQQAIDTEVAIETALTALHAQACADLPTEVRAALQAIRVNRRTWPSLPVAHLVAERSEPEWLALREALATARIAAVSDGEVDDAATQAIANAEVDPAVQTALFGAAVHGAAVEAAWGQQVQSLAAGDG
jgi:hypothetical protein